MVYSNVDGNNDLEEETREFEDIRNPNLEYITFVGIFFNLDLICCGDGS